MIPGDGIGVEVVEHALRVLDELGTRFGFELHTTRHAWSCRHYLEHGTMMDADGLKRLQHTDAIFLGAVGDPGVPDHVSLWGLLIPIRRTFQQYVNLRPVRLLPGTHTPLRNTAPEDIDMLVVRENNEGEYSEIGGRLYHHSPHELAVQQTTFTRRGVERIVRHAFEQARRRRRRVCSATKSNGIIHTMPFWDEIFAEVSEQFPDVETEQMHIDALSAKLVLEPARFDVIVGSNLFGDILSDLAAGVAGSIGIAPSANLNPDRTAPSMFEPVHGSAPDIAGRGIANPLGQLWSAAMMLDHLGEHRAAIALEQAFSAVLAETDIRTPDLGGKATGEQFTDAVLAALAASSNASS